MKILSNYQNNAAFEEEKDRLEEEFDDYAALATEERDVHLKEIPDMVDIALWDRTEEKILMIRGWEYTAENYPTDRYKAIGVEVIPKSHMSDGHARIMSLRGMSCTNPMYGSDVSYYSREMRFGLYLQNITDIKYKSYIPSINESGTTNFGDVQEIKFWYNPNNYRFSGSNDSHIDIINPFTKNQGYRIADDNPICCPSPYLKNMLPNPIYFTENPDESKPSALLNFDGKGETAKILNQLAINLGNEDWKTGNTIPSTTSETLGWDKIAPACQCAWLYHISDEFKDNHIFGQGQWYIPTIGEGLYMLARYNSIRNAMLQIQTVSDDFIIVFGGENVWTCSTLYNAVNFLINTESNIGLIWTINRSENWKARAFCLI